MMKIKYNRGDLALRLFAVVIMLVVFVIALFAFSSSSFLDVTGETGGGLMLLCFLLFLMLLVGIIILVRGLFLKFAVKFSDEQFTFSAQVLKSVCLKDLAFISCDEQDSREHDNYQKKIKKKLFATRTNQQLLVLNFSIVDSKSWDDFWTDFAENAGFYHISYDDIIFTETLFRRFAV
ncbi:hypothetical protein Hs30E_10860 [Lactococcus hodotermopsidis]|uniref:Uncharacterized protein n=1 Tax=Pseudolactococcus hodotermopsidis TaxID=2709157 RepID=A0A6A0BD06_9LACT|nr:hypothetical protein [Lactococcus hodotermopsidis]GFH42535.1 hypothetical protein Hs30E_10860 [Lactococcus hodotermopsidis]